MAERVKSVKAKKKKMVRVGFVRNGLTMSTWFDESDYHDDYYIGVVTARYMGLDRVVSVTRNVSPYSGPLPAKKKGKVKRGNVS